MKLSGKFLKIFLTVLALAVVYFFVFDVRYTCTLFSNKLGCYGGNLEKRLDWFGVDDSRGYLKKLFDEGFLNQGQCHTLGHKIGQRAAESGVGMIEAMEDNSSFCGWAFFHGVMEGLFGTGAGHGKISVDEAHRICAELDYPDPIQVFNCSHALGHGFYALDYDLKNSLDRCDLAQDGSRRGFCYDGIFMAMTFPREDSRTNLMRSDLISGGLTSICEELADGRRLYCYWRLVPIKVFAEELELPPVGSVLETLETIPDDYKSIFWNGFGRELDSRFASSYEVIDQACGWGGDKYKLTCVTGAAMHMIFYDQGETKRAEDLCRSTLSGDDLVKCVGIIKLKAYPNLRD